jgi:hypothetical protein
MEPDLGDTTMPRKRLPDGESKPQSLKEVKGKWLMVLDGDPMPDDDLPLFSAN